MSNDFNEPAYPFGGWLETLNGREFVGYSPGLTIRQQAALMMAQGLVAQVPWDQPWSIEGIAGTAMALADAVLKREMETR